MSENKVSKNELNQLFGYKSSNSINNFHGDLHKSRKEGKFTLSTIIYKKFGKGENKKKRYEKITNDIKKIEQKSKKELLKLSNLILNTGKKLEEEKEKYETQNKQEEFKNDFQDKLFNLQNKKLMALELEKDNRYNYLEVIQKLKIPPAQRTVRDTLRIKTYLIQSKLYISINEEFPDKNLVEKIITFCSIEMQYRRFRKGEIIVKIGERLDSFYSIIIGKINIMKPFKKTVNMTGFEYFKYLMELKKNHETYMINQCIKENEHNYVIETNHIDIIHYIYLLNYLEYIHLNKKPAKELDDVLSLINLNPQELGLDPNKFNSGHYKHDYLRVIKKKLPNISHILFDQYSFFNDYNTTKEVTIYEYKKVNTLKTNDFFGDSVIEHRETMNETFIAEEDCDMAVLTNKLYYEQIASEKTVLQDKKIADLHQNHFFRLIKYGKFSKKYFKYFINEKYNKGDIIFNEGEEIKYIYFIQEGTLDLSITKSINEIDYLTEVLLDKEDIILDKEELDFNDLTNNNYTFEEFLLQQKSSSNNIQPSNSNDEIDMNYLNQKQNNKLIILNNNEDIGIISLILGNEYISTCTVTSNTAEVYKLDIGHLKLILFHEYECKDKLFERLKDKIDLIKERLIKISDTKLAMRGKKEIKEKQLIEEKESKKYKTLKSSNIKTLIDYEKISNLMEHKDDMNSSYIKINISPEQGKSKIENINLPLLNSFKKINLSNDKSSNEEDSNEMSKSKILDLMKKGLMFNLNEVRKKKMINQKQKIEVDKKITKKMKFEDKMISTLQKDIKEFSLKNKFNITKGSSPNNNIMSYTNNNRDKIYLTQLNILNHLKPFNETEREKIDYKTNRSNYKPKKEKISLPRKLNNLQKIFSYSDKNNTKENEIKTNFIRFNTEENLINDKAKVRNSYKNPLAMIKQERYKIFERKAIGNKYDFDYFSESIEKMKKLKKIYFNMKQNSSPKYRNNIFK